MLHACAARFDVTFWVENFWNLNGALDSKKFCAVPVTSNLAAHVWSTKCRRKKKLITQFTEKSRDKTFEPT